MSSSDVEERDAVVSRVFYVVLVTGVMVYALWPWIRAVLVPSMDFPSHLALVEVMRGLGDVDSAVARKFTWGFFPAPNSMFYVLTYLLSYVFGTLWAGRIVFVGMMALQIVAVGYFAQVFGRNRWVIFAVMPLVAQWTLTEGFLDYYLGVAFLFLAVAVQHRYHQKPTWPRAIAVGCMGILVFLGHVQAFLFYGLWSCVLLFLHSTRQQAEFVSSSSWRSTLRSVAVVFLPCLSVALLWFLATRGLVGQSSWGSSIAILFEPFEKRVFHLFRHSVMAFVSPGHGLIVAVVFLGWLCSRSIMIWGVSAVRDERINETFLALAFAVVLAIFFFAPLNVGLYWNLYNRSVLVLWLLLACMIFPRGSLRSETWGLLAIVPLLIALGVTRGEWSKSLQIWDRYTYGLTEVLSKAPKGSHLFFVAEQQSHVGMHSVLWRHLAQYHTVLNRGTTSYSFGIQPGRLIRERHPRPYAQNREFGNLHDLHTLEKYGCFDVVLQVGYTRIEQQFPQRFQLLTRRQHWSLYRIQPQGRCRS